MQSQKGGFAEGAVWRNIGRLAGPLIFAQLVNVLYSVVDRMYIARLPDAAANALTGVGLTFPVLSMITAFANLFGSGAAPLFSMARGRGDTQGAGRILGCCCALLLSCGAALIFLGYLIKKPLLYLFGASAATFPYADGYLSVYLLGTVFALLSLGLNGFINAQGRPVRGMMTVMLGAAANLALDPLFIFVFGLGVTGAAAATVISQFLSALWAVSFLMRGAPVRLKLKNLRIDPALTRQITALGVSGFMMKVTNSGVQIVSNATLSLFGGDLYVGVMTVLGSVREIVFAPAEGLTAAAQPVLSFNYGAREYGRVRQGIRVLTVSAVAYLTAVWLCLIRFPDAFIGLFNQDAALAAAAKPAMLVYFFGIFMMSLQNVGQTAAVSLGKSRQAVFFSLFRKAFLVIPLTLLFPRIGLGAAGVFLAEPVSNFLGGGACFLTMLFTIGRELKRLEQKENT